MSVLKQASKGTEVHEKQDPSSNPEGKSAGSFRYSFSPLSRTFSNNFPPQLASFSAPIINSPDKGLEVSKMQLARAMRAASIV